MTTALIADDEPLLREALERQLAQAWPELQIVARARNGREAVDLYEVFQPDVCFLDIKMPGVTGLEAAELIGRQAHIVFVTAFDEYAVKAFEAGVLDYLVKPVALARLTETVHRLKERLASAAPAIHNEALLRMLAAQLGGAAGPVHLRWLKVQVGTRLKVIGTEAIDYLRSEAKYTLVAWRSETGQACEALIRTPLKDVLAGLDPAVFVQVHRSAAVNLGAVDHVARGDNETGILHLKGRRETLPVSRAQMGQFRAS